jgi:hypothetical protein
MEGKYETATHPSPGLTSDSMKKKKKKKKKITYHIITV